MHSRGFKRVHCAICISPYTNALSCDLITHDLCSCFSICLAAQCLLGQLFTGERIVRIVSKVMEMNRNGTIVGSFSVQIYLERLRKICKTMPVADTE